MKISIIIILILSVFFITCSNHVFDNPVDPESDNYMGIESVDRDGDGVGSYEDVDEIAITDPVGGIVITDTASPTLTVQLLNPEVITFYRIQISTESDFTSDIVFDNSTLTSNIYTVPAGVFTNNTTYFWRAMAFDGSKWSDSWSNSSSFSIDIPTEVPLFPNPIDTNSTGDATPFLNWEDIIGVTGYHIQVNEVSNFTGTIIVDDATLLDSEYLINLPLENNKTYYWRVKIKDSDSLWGDWSKIWSFTISIEIPTLTLPEDGSSVIDTTPLLDWEGVSGINDYQIRYANNSLELINATINNTIISEYPITAVQTLGSTICWQVRSISEDGVMSDWSTEYSFSVDWNINLSNINPINGGSTTDKTPLIEWDPFVGAASYQFRSTTVESDLTIATIENVAIPKYQYSIMFDIEDTVYWQVRAINDDGVISEWSSIMSFLIFPSLGDSYAGGIVFYIDGLGGGLIAAESDESRIIEWGGMGTIIGGTGTAIGTGEANTVLIVNKLGNETSAAKLCADKDYNGYDDWFLPSKDELNLMYQQKSVIGGFIDYDYLSSSESSSTNAWDQFFADGTCQMTLKNDFVHNVRAIRSFSIL